MTQPIDLNLKLAQVQKLWTPHRIARFDGHQLVLARVSGEFVWHDHAEHDEVFIPLSGTLVMDLEGEESPQHVEAGQILVVPAGTRHRPRTLDGEEVTMLVIDPLSVQHTGGVRDELTVDDYPEI